ncbi:hypothetical protein R1sor_013239 [Riccia sorocarpa]|uniref:Uncharacterized protein n=1 Tax=Riccia sorocarpa TaxID=122646 RepID=A0ABD3H9J6_9MARC
MDRKESVSALGYGLLSAKTSQIGGMIEKFITSAKNFKLLEREAIKETLEADDEDSMDDEDFFKEMTADQAETARLWEENKKKSVKGKEKVVPTALSKIGQQSSSAQGETSRFEHSC